ncbi:unnamed protein product, partial [marine sediment metagenome]
MVTSGAAGTAMEMAKESLSKPVLEFTLYPTSKEGKIRFKDGIHVTITLATLALVGIPGMLAVLQTIVDAKKVKGGNSFWYRKLQPVVEGPAFKQWQLMMNPLAAFNQMSADFRDGLMGLGEGIQDAVDPTAALEDQYQQAQEY